MRIRFTLMATILLTMLCAGCQKHHDITIIHSTPPISLDPLALNDLSTHYVLYNVYESLVGYDEELKIVPILASSWSTPEPTRWIFRLRPKIRFHDGQILNAEDVKYSIDRIRNNEHHVLKPYFDDIIEILIPDPLTVEIITAKEIAPLPHYLISVMIMKNSSPTAGGTGPYCLVQADEKEIILKRFSGYHGEKPEVERALFLYRKTETERLALASTREHFIVLDFTELPEDIPFKAVEKATLSKTVTYLGFNVTMPPFDSPALRQAIYRAINVERIIQKRLHGKALPVSQLIPIHAFGYDGDLERYSYDPERAKKLLLSGGFTTPLTLKLHLSPKGEPTGIFIKEDLARIGINLELEITPWSKLYDDLLNRRTGFYFSGFSSTFGDGLSSMNTLFSSQGGFNTFNFINPDLDQLLMEGMTAMDDTERLRLIKEANRLVHDKVVAIPLYNRFDRRLCSPYIEWEPSEDGIIHLERIKIR